MKIAITGAAGFIGGCLSKQLLALGRSVITIDQSHHVLSLTGTESRVGDLRDAQAAVELLKGTDLCIALAAKLGGVGYFTTHPASIQRDNLLIISNTLEACRQNKIERVIYVSSSCVFSTNCLPPFREEDLRTQDFPQDGYSFSKLAGENLCHSYKREFGLDFTILRPFNVYGPGEPAGDKIGDGHVIPEMTRRILMGELPLRILGNGDQTRSFLYVDDLIEAIILCIDNRGSINLDFNIGTDREISMKNLAREIWRSSNRKEELKFSHVERFSGDVQRRSANNLRAKKILGWVPRTELEMGINLYVGWCSRNLGRNLPTR